MLLSLSKIKKGIGICWTTNYRLIQGLWARIEFSGKARLDMFQKWKFSRSYHVTQNYFLNWCHLENLKQSSWKILNVSLRIFDTRRRDIKTNGVQIGWPIIVEYWIFQKFPYCLYKMLIFCRCLDFFKTWLQWNKFYFYYCKHNKIPIIKKIVGQWNIILAMLLGYFR